MCRLWAHTCFKSRTRDTSRSGGGGDPPMTLTSVTSTVSRSSVTARDLWSVLSDTCTGSTVCFWKSTFTLEIGAKVECHTENIYMSELPPERPHPAISTRAEHFTKTPKPEMMNLIEFGLVSNLSVWWLPEPPGGACTPAATHRSLEHTCKVKATLEPHPSRTETLHLGPAMFAELWFQR